MTVRIVTDSTVHLAPDVIQQFGIVVVPCRIRIDDREYLDGIDLGEEDFYSLVYEQGKSAETRPPLVEDLYSVYRTLNQETTEIISIHISEALSRTCEHARRAVDMLLGQCKIVVIDSQTVSMGLGILVEAAARAAAEGQALDDIVRLVRGLIPQVYVVFFSENLDYLERGGRIGHAQALLGTMLGIKPFLTLEEGEILPMEKVRTRPEALEKLIEFVSEFDAIRRLAIVKGALSRSDEIESLLASLRELFPALDIPVINYGPVLASHIGPNTLGMIVYEDASFVVE
jgi:DegV family protein with EDD domain